MLDESLVFHKTELGQAEIAGTARTLQGRLRRALIMVDGARTVAQLAPLVRPGELDGILEELQAGGFISLAGGTLADLLPGGGSGDAPAAAPGPDAAERFDRARRLAMREVMDRLGPNGDELALLIERCRGASDLRAAMRDAERILSGFIGAAAARDFAQRIGRELG